MWPLEGYWNEGEVRTLFSLGVCSHRQGNVFPSPVHRMRSRWVLAVRRLWDGAEVVGSQTAPPLLERLAITGVAVHSQVPRAPLSSTHLRSRCHGRCTLHAGPYCSVCASGYFRKGKICAPCDDGTKNVMYANVAAGCGAPGEMFVVRLPSFYLRKVGPYRRIHRRVPARCLCRSPQDCVCRLRLHGRETPFVITRTHARKATHPLTRCYPVTLHARAHQLINPHAHTQRATLRRSGARRISL